MPAATASPRLLVAVSALIFAATFAAFLALEQPGLGIGHFYYVAIAVGATATGARGGALAGVAATSLYAVGVILNPHVPPTEVPTVSTAIRAATFVTIGLLVGHFAHRHRALVRELRILAERDVVTGLPNVRAFERAIGDQLAAGKPFALLVGEIDGLDRPDTVAVAGDDALHRLSDTLARSLSPGDYVARVKTDEFAVLRPADRLPDARDVADHLERTLMHAGQRASFGWAVYPQDGVDALALYRAADERRYARKLVRTPRDTNTVTVASVAAAR